MTDSSYSVPFFAGLLVEFLHADAPVTGNPILTLQLRNSVPCETCNSLITIQGELIQLELMHNERNMSCLSVRSE